MESELKRRLGSWLNGLNRLNRLRLPGTLHLHARATAWVSQSVRNKLLAMALGPLVVVFPLLVVALTLWGNATYDRLLITKVRSDLAVAHGYFDRVLMFDVVEHLHPWELHEAMLEVGRVLKPDGKFIIHTAPNVWYDKYAYPVVRQFRRLLGQGDKYPKDPRQFLVEHNQHVHVNEQSLWSMYQALHQAGFSGKVWLDSPPQKPREGAVLEALRGFVFKVAPFRWFFEREVFAVAGKRTS